MYLKSLTLKGFKSFARPATFVFEPGVTCVVGPNGSGKSNIVDALAWVMGEQGAKSLRGGTMQDVIFAGTPDHAALGRAQVTLTIDNTDGALPIDYTEVTISRTLFRGGGSEYAINGEQCRLLDVQELLSDSGLGRHMHVIVGQGKLEAILGQSAWERRALVEEAAGVLKHRRRKESTLRKLEAMQANLDRVTDLAAEIRRQLKPLGRQAHLAEEAKAVQAAARDAAARLLAADVAALREAETADTAEETRLRSEAAILREGLDSVRATVRHAQSALDQGPWEAARTTVFDLRHSRDRLLGLHALVSQRLTLLAESERAEPAQPLVADDEVREAEEAVRRAGAARVQAVREEQQARADVETAREAFDAARQDRAARQARAREQEQRSAVLAARFEAAQSRLEALHEDFARQERDTEAAASRSTVARADLGQCPEPSDDRRGALAQRHQEATAETDVRAHAALEARERVHELQRRRDALAASLETMDAAMAGEDGSAALLTGAEAGLLGLLAEHVRVRAGFETAIAAALGERGEAVLAARLSEALRLAAHAARRGIGHVEIVVAEPESPEPSAPTLPPGAIWAPEAVEGPAGVRSLLRRSAIVPDLAAARGWRPEGGIERLITRAGEVVGADHVSGGGERGTGRIHWAARRREAAEALHDVDEEISRASAALADALRAAEESREKVLAARQQLDDEVARGEKARALRERAVTHAEAAEAEERRLAAALEQARAAVHTAQSTRDQAAALAEEASARPMPQVDDAAADRAARAFEEARDRELERRLRTRAAAEAEDAARRRAAGLRERRTTLLEARRRAEEQETLRQERIGRAGRVADRLPALLEAAERSVAAAEADLARLQAGREASEAVLAEARGREEKLSVRLHEAGEELHTVELRLHEDRLRRTGLAQRSSDTLGLTLEALEADYGTGAGPDAEEPFDRAREEARLAKAQQSLARLGTVNPLALEEFRALEQRHAFLNEQVDDLLATRKDLRAILAEVDQRMQQVFAEAFEDTRRAFTQVLPLLFPGGSGTLRLSDPEDAQESGIEIAVRPAGKRVDRLSLLSGGERALAAVALLVAIFKARPSPFYIMDEIEAALDDANLGRLLDVFSDLRSSSQLIIITHQKRTMEAADALYGVSMQRDGVSAVVGQRLS